MQQLLADLPVHVVGCFHYVPDLKQRSVCFQVLDAGKIQAYDEPYTLLQDPEGIFYKMLQQTGKQEAAALMEAAKQVSSTCRTKI